MWSFWCDLLRKSWQQRSIVGKRETLAELQVKHDAVFSPWMKKHPSVDPSTVSLEERNKINAKFGVTRCGIRFGERPLFDIELSDYNRSSLHIILGITAELWKRQKTAVRAKIQVNTAEEQTAYVALDAAEIAVEVATADNVDPQKDRDIIELERAISCYAKAVGEATTRHNEATGAKNVERALLNSATTKLEKNQANLVTLKAEKKAAVVALAAAETALEAVEKKVEKLLEKKGRAGPCIELMGDILEEHKISEDGRFGGSFTGNRCHRLVEEFSTICYKLRVGFRKFSRPGVTGPDIDELLYPFECLFRHFSVCCGIMRSTEEQTDDAIESFRKSAVDFAKLWRVTFAPNIRAPPKLHDLEEHCYEILLEWGCIGIFDENPVEILHHEHNVLMKIMSGLKDYIKRETYLYERKAAMATCAADELYANIAASRKRQFSDETLERRERMKNGVDKKLLVKMEEVQKFIEKKRYDVIDLTNIN